MEFKPSSYRSGFIGLAVAGGVAAVAFGLATVIVTRGGVSLQRPFSLLVLGLGVAFLITLVALALLVYWSIAVFRLRYRLDRNGLTIHWGATKLVVPIERIQTISLGREMDVGGNEASGWRVFRGLGWAGLRVGRVQLPEDRPARVFATSSPDQSTVVLTPDGAYIVAPRDPVAFVEAWQVRRSLGPTQHWQEEEQRARFLSLPIWRDWLAWALVGLALLANFALHGYLSVVYDRLPEMLSFHFDLLGQADRVASRVEILRLPQIASLMLILDLTLGFILYRRQRTAAYLVWGGGLILQLLVWGSVLTIIG